MLVTVLLTAAAGCATPQAAAPPRAPDPCKEPERVPLVLDGAPNLNPGPDGQPLPTVVHIYQLKGMAKLELSSLDDVIRDHQKALEGDLLEWRELTLVPGTRQIPDMLRKPETTHLGVVAFVRRPTGPSWRAVATLLPPDPFHCYRSGREKSRWIQFFLQAYQVVFVP